MSLNPWPHIVFGRGTSWNAGYMGSYVVAVVSNDVDYVLLKLRCCWVWELGLSTGLAVLKVIEKEQLQQNAFVVGSHLKERLTALKDKYELIGDVRGRGLMLGVELVTDRELKTPAKNETLHVMDQMKELGVLIGKGGYYGNVFRITPPLCFTKEDADFVADAMDLTLSRM
ncbi:Alanine--glyoxylate aminotransferase 2 like 2, mitochondrial [Glycine soja]|nr:Alanine--glyoxylate aminotransferase 2 like 2, mitochondrial [Glycine soja]